MLATRGVVAADTRHVGIDSEHHAGAVGIGLDPKEDTLLVLLGEPARLQEWNWGTTRLAPDHARPQVGDGRLRDPTRTCRIVEPRPLAVAWARLAVELTIQCGDVR